LPDVDPNIVRRINSDAQLVDVFCREATESGMIVHRAGRHALAEAVGEVLQTVQRGADPARLLIEAGQTWTDTLRSAFETRAELLSFHDGDPALFGADVAITGVEAAVAETGSIVCASGLDRWRSASLVPPAQIAIVFRDQIIPDLVDLLTAERISSGGSALALITGPSKTADIEGILITGVHGPGVVHILVLED
jgi:L-lactate utilization protein LutC